MERTAWPCARGWMSMNARTRSLSKSLKAGMSPGCSKGSAQELDAVTLGSRRARCLVSFFERKGQRF